MKTVFVLAVLSAAVYFYAYGAPSPATVRERLDKGADTVTRAVGAVKREVVK